MTSRLEEDLSRILANKDEVESRGVTAARGADAPSSSRLSAPSSSSRTRPGDASSAALADALSSSLANIVASANAKNHSRLTNRTDEASNHSSEESGVSSSSNSSGALHHDGKSGPAVVTTGTSSSGFDDRDSSAGGNGSGGASKGDSGSDSRQAEKHHHHHHHHGGHGRRKQAPQPPTEELNSPEDGYGLPVPKDDRLQTDETPTAHAAVVAQHLPPPRSDSNSSGESEKASGRRVPSPLLQPRREPVFHTIRKTFNKVARHGKGSERDSSNGVNTHQKYKLTGKRHVSLEQKILKTKKRKLEEQADRGSDNDEAGGNGSSGSGTEGGYAASASSNENNAQAGSCSSSEESMFKRRKRPAVSSALTRDPSRQLISQKRECLSVSSEIADFSSGASEADISHGFAAAFRPTSSPSITSSSDEQEEPSDEDKVAIAVGRKRPSAAWPRLPIQVNGEGVDLERKLPGRSDARSSIPAPTLGGKPPILAIGCDMMAHVLTFLEPPGILEVLTMPLSKDWLSSFTRQPELWRVLCLLDPFKAKLEDDADGSDDSLDSYGVDVESELRKTFGKYRLLYTNFVRCLKYLSRIKDDALSGRPPSVLDYGAQGRQNITANLNLQQFLARAKGVVVGSGQAESVDNSDISDDENAGGVAAAGPAGRSDPVGISDDGSSLPSDSKRHASGNLCNMKKKRKVRYAHSALTQRLLGPSADGTPGNVALPWSCAIYSIVNWTVAFADVEGIQTMCLKVLPFILEDEQQRITAQRAGLTDIVLRAMVMFPNSAPLHTAAFHTLVLLARPLGGHEGMLFHSSMVNSSGIFGTDGSATDGRSGIAVMLDSMRRFEDNEVLQAMSCWSLVNIALAPAQKAVLVKLGGIAVAANAMTAHAFSAEVQFRALFALINLVIPSVNVNDPDPEEDGVESVIEVDDSTEKEMLDEIVDHVVNLVVLAMKNFCASEAIVNRACLVLHNLSLTQEYHRSLLLCPNCYQMLEWCLGNYRTDEVLQQSAAGTLHRLQITLSGDDRIRALFAASLQSQNQLSLEQAHREAVALSEQQEHAEPADALTSLH